MPPDVCKQAQAAPGHDTIQATAVRPAVEMVDSFWLMRNVAAVFGADDINILRPE